MDTDDATGRGSRAAAPDAVGPIRVDAEPLRYEPALDGIRALAVLAVMAFHFLGAEYFAGGLIGVDVFFVLSGFLITSLLLDEQNRTGAVSLRGFYHRRVLRLFPAMYTLLALLYALWLVYAGGIDSIPSSRVDDIPKATPYIRQALGDIKAGKPLSVSTSQAYGCSVKYKS